MHMMLELGIGDAYGACFEGCEASYVEANNDLHFGGKQPSIVPSGRYTDDTQMSIAIAEMMLDDFEWNHEDSNELMADKFLEVFKRDERRGYTPYFLNVLLNCSSGTELLSKINGKSNKSGGFMRAAPIGLYPDLNDVMEIAARQAMVTHDSWVGRNSAIGAAMMTHYFYYDRGDKADLVEWLNKMYFMTLIHKDEEFRVHEEVVQPWQPGKRVRVHGWDCLEAAIYAIQDSSSLSQVLQTCVSYTGDVDTVATVALAAASCSREIKQDLPAKLVEQFENRGFGRDFLMQLDEKLQEKFPCKP
jgi:ADP-ribosyl-[dinitrogen reductase] hydrolase